MQKMAGKRNAQVRWEASAQRRPQYGLRKLKHVGAASVLLGTTLWLGQVNAQADTMTPTPAPTSANDATTGTNTGSVATPTTPVVNSTPTVAPSVASAVTPVSNPAPSVASVVTPVVTSSVAASPVQPARVTPAGDGNDTGVSPVSATTGAQPLDGNDTSLRSVSATTGTQAWDSNDTNPSQVSVSVVTPLDRNDTNTSLGLVSDVTAMSSQSRDGNDTGVSPVSATAGKQLGDGNDIDLRPVSAGILTSDEMNRQGMTTMSMQPLDRNDTNTRPVSTSSVTNLPLSASRAVRDGSETVTVDGGAWHNTVSVDPRLLFTSLYQVAGSAGQPAQNLTPAGSNGYNRKLYEAVSAWQLREYYNISATKSPAIQGQSSSGGIHYHVQQQFSHNVGTEGSSYVIYQGGQYELNGTHYDITEFNGKYYLINVQAAANGVLTLPTADAQGHQLSIGTSYLFALLHTRNGRSIISGNPVITDFEVKSVNGQKLHLSSSYNPHLALGNVATVYQNGRWVSGSQGNWNKGALTWDSSDMRKWRGGGHQNRNGYRIAPGNQVLNDFVYTESGDSAVSNDPMALLISPIDNVDYDGEGVQMGLALFGDLPLTTDDAYQSTLTRANLTALDTSELLTMHCMFMNDRLTTVGDLSGWDTSNVVNMSAIFYNSDKLTNVGNLGNWKTSQVTDMNSMFASASNLTNVGDLSNWDTSKVRSMRSMFEGTTKLKSIGQIGRWNVGNVQEMNDMFAHAGLAGNLDLSKWNVSKVTNMHDFMYDARYLQNIGNLANWNTANVTDMSQMFNSMWDLQYLGNLDNWNTAKVTSTRGMFYGDGQLRNIGTLAKWQMGNNRDMSFMFADMQRLDGALNLSAWDTHNVTDMKAMFMNTQVLGSVGDLSKWQTGQVTDMSCMFQKMPVLTSLGNLGNWDVHNVTNMAYMFMNSRDSKLNYIGDLSKWNVGKVTNMDGMFQFDASLTSIGDLSNWDTHNVTDMAYMFNTAKKLQSIGHLDRWQTGKVTNMRAMFTNLWGVKDLGNLNNWDTHNVTDMSFMFANNGAQPDSAGLTNIGDLSGWDVGRVTDMTAMFQIQTKLTKIGRLDNWNVGNVANMSSMFMDAASLVDLGNLNNWNTRNVTDMSQMFNSMWDLQYLGNLDNWNTAKVTSTRGMFYGDGQLRNIGTLAKWQMGNNRDMSFMFADMQRLDGALNLSAWDTHNVTDMKAMFMNTQVLGSVGDLSKWQTGQVTDMSCMFQKMPVLTSLGNLGNWDVHNVTNMAYMFMNSRDSKLNYIGDLSKWNVGKVTNMDGMFQFDASLTSIGDLSNWDTHNVTDMAYMFNTAKKLQSIGHLDRWQTGKVTNMRAMFTNLWGVKDLGNLNNWDTHNVTDMSFMFANNGAQPDSAGLTNIGDLSGWDVGRVTDMTAMFQIQTKLTKIGRLDNWNVGNVANMSSMFMDAASLVDLGNLNNWNTRNVTNMANMFNNAKKLQSIGHLDRWQTGKVTNMDSMFYNLWSLKDLGNLTNWDVHNVTNMAYMFANYNGDPGYSEDYGLTNIGDLSRWNVGRVTTMKSMFERQSQLSRIGDLSNWNVGNVTDMSDMFHDTWKLTGVTGLDHWNVGNVKTMTEMFRASSIPVGPMVTNWDVRKVTNMDRMFMDLGNQAVRYKVYPNYKWDMDLSKWNTVGLTSAQDMFYGSFIPVLNLNGPQLRLPKLSGFIFGHTAWGHADWNFQLPYTQLVVLGAQTAKDVLGSSQIGAFGPMAIELADDVDKITADQLKARLNTAKVNDYNMYYVSVDFRRDFASNQSIIRDSVTNGGIGSFWMPMVYSGTTNSEIDLQYLLKVTDALKDTQVDQSSVKWAGFRHDYDSMTNNLHSLVEPDKLFAYNDPKYGYYHMISGEVRVDALMQVIVHVVDDDNNGATIGKDQVFTAKRKDAVTLPGAPSGYDFVSYDGNRHPGDKFGFNDWSPAKQTLTMHVKHHVTVDHSTDPGGHNTGKIDDPTDPNSPNYDNTPRHAFETIFKTVRLVIIGSGTDHPASWDEAYSSKEHSSFIIGVEGDPTSGGKIKYLTAKGGNDRILSWKQDLTYDEATKSLKYYIMDPNHPDDPKYIWADYIGSGPADVNAPIDDYTLWQGWQSFVVDKPQGYNWSVTVGKTGTKWNYVQDTGTQLIISGPSVGDNLTLTLTLMPETTSTTVTWVDHGKVVGGPLTVAVAKDNTVLIPQDVPNGYELVPSQPSNPQVQFNADGTLSPVVIQVQQHLEFVPHTLPHKQGDYLAHSDHRYPAGVSYDDLNKTVTRTINIPGEDPIIDSVTSYRDAYVNAVTGQVDHYTAWTTGTWEAHMIPTKPGYKVNPGSVGQMTVNGDTPNQVIDVVYVAEQNRQVDLRYVGPNGQVVDHKVIQGPSDSDLTVPSFPVPDGWHLVDENQPMPETVHVGTEDTHYDVAITPDIVAVDSSVDRRGVIPGTVGKHFNSATQQALLSTTKYRNVLLIDPDGAVHSLQQANHLERVAYVDASTGAIVGYDDWTGDTHRDAVTLPQFTGFSPVVTGNLNAETVDPFAADEEVTVRYQPTTWTVTVKVVDVDTNQVVKSVNVTGHANQGWVATGIATGDLTGWRPADDNDALPVGIQFDDIKPADITYRVRHNVVPVTSDLGGTATTNLMVVNSPSRLALNNLNLNLLMLNRQVTRQVKLTLPDGQATTQTQTATVHRDATVDLATGDVQYGDWSTANFAPVSLLTLPDGYSWSGVDSDQLAASKVAVDTPNLVLAAEATPTQVSQVVQVVDADDPQRPVLGQVTVKGNAGQRNVAFDGLSVPTGYTGSLPGAIDLPMQDGDPIQLEVHHKTLTVTNVDQIKAGEAIDGAKAGVTWPSDLASQMTATVSRRITLQLPSGTDSTTVPPQTATLHRNAVIDLVTGKVQSLGDWQPATLAAVDKMTLPSVPGYQAVNDIPEQVVATPDQDVKDVVVEYQPQTIMVPVKYHVTNATDGEQTIDDHWPVDYGTTLTPTEMGELINNWLRNHPGYVWVDQDRLQPVKINLSGQNDPIQVEVQAQTVTVQAGHGHNQGEAVGDQYPGLVYPAGVTNDDLTKTVTRTIAIKKPNAVPEVVKQTATISRDATVNLATGQVTYGKWQTSDQWGEQTLTFEQGYTPTVLIDGTAQDRTDLIPQGDPTKGVDSTVVVDYDAQTQHTTVTFVTTDGTSLGQPQVVSGKTGQTVPLHLTVPDGYVVNDAQAGLPKQVVFGAQTDPITVVVRPQVATIDANHPLTSGESLPGATGYHAPSGLSAEDLNQTVTRTIVQHLPSGNKTLKQTVTLHRDGKWNLSDNTVSYTPWSTGQWEAVSAKDLSVPGYQAQPGSVAAQTVSDPSQNLTVDVNYAGNAWNTTIKVIDHDQNDQVLQTVTVKGQTGQTIPVTGLTLPKGMRLQNQGQTWPDSISFDQNGHPDVDLVVVHDRLNVTPGLGHDAGEPVDGHAGLTWPTGVSDSDLSQTATRTIVWHLPSGDKTTHQSVTLIRTASVDLATGEVTYSDWSRGNLISVTNPAVAGYTAQGGVENLAVAKPGDYGTVAINYVASAQHVNVAYQGPDGTVVKRDTITGDSNAKTTYQPQAPTGWTLADGQDATVPVTFDNDQDQDQTLVVKVQHGHVTVPDGGTVAGQPVPNGNGAKWQTTIPADALNKTITRTITYHSYHDDAPATAQQQTTNWHRTADYDLVDGTVKYGEWQAVGANRWDAVNVPIEAGLVADQTVIPAVVVDPNKQQNVQVDVHYNKAEHSQTLQVVDDDANGKVVAQQTLTGAEGDQVPVTIKVPAGYELVGTGLPKTVTITADLPATQVVHVKHHHTTVSAGDSLPSEIKVDDLQTTRRRGWVLRDAPQGTAQTQGIQVVTLNRTATIDEVTRQVQYGAWSTGQWTAITVPDAPAGYHRVVHGDLGAQAVTIDTPETTVTVDYLPDQLQQTLQLVDDDANGKVVATQTVTGNYQGQADVNLAVPQGYELVPGQAQVPDRWSFDQLADHGTKTWHLRHQKLTYQTGDTIPAGSKIDALQKKITRTIKYVGSDNNPSPIVQTTFVNRQATVDLVTGAVKYTPWTTSQFEAVKTTGVAGYVADQAQVAVMPVTAETPDQTVTVTYHAVQAQQRVEYLDAKSGKVIGQTTLQGQRGEVKHFTATDWPNQPAGWVAIKGDWTVTLKDQAPVLQVPMQHAMQTLEPGQTVPSDWPKGTVTTKTVTRTINFVDASGQALAQLVQQTATLHRSATLDLVDHTVSYGEWQAGTVQAVTAPTVDGYVTKQGTVAQANLTDDTTVNVVYTPVSVTGTLHLVDQATGKTITTVIGHAVTGTTGNWQQLGAKVPTGWHLVEPGRLQQGHLVKGTWSDTVMIAKDQSQPSQPTQPTQPTEPEHGGSEQGSHTSGGADSQISQGSQSATSSSAHSSATSSASTGSSATGSDNTSQSGHPTTPDGGDQGGTDETTPTEQRQQVISYVDDDAAGKVVKTQTVTGQLGATTKVDWTLPQGYQLAANQVLPGDVHWTKDTPSAVTIHLKHQFKAVTDDPALSLTADSVRTVVIKLPTGDPQVTTQTVHFTRTAEQDLVTGEYRYSDWHVAGTNQWDAVAVPTVDDYVADQAQVAAQTLTKPVADETVTINYHAVQQTVTVELVDEASGQVVKSIPVTVARGSQLNPWTVVDHLPSGWEWAEQPAVSGVPQTVTADLTSVKLYVKAQLPSHQADQPVSGLITTPKETGTGAPAVPTAVTGTPTKQAGVTRQPVVGMSVPSSQVNHRLVTTGLPTRATNEAGADHEARLPQTGSSDRMAWSLAQVGLVLLGLSGALLADRRRRSK